MAKTGTDSRNQRLSAAVAHRLAKYILWQLISSITEEDISVRRSMMSTHGVRGSALCTPTRLLVGISKRAP
jgi:hypothetical protein